MPLLETVNLDKRFGGHHALSHVSMTVEPGEVLGLVGENGAGKSTFIKIITGVYHLDGGRILWQGKDISIHSPRDARRFGINVVHQDRNLVPSFTGMENIFLGSEYPHSKFYPAVDWKGMQKKVEALMADLGIQVPIDIQAQYMTPPQCTLVEILRAMLWDCKLLFLDEPTASLTDQETDVLFKLIGRLKSKGTAIIYVSHRMDEIFKLSDRITVLRNGIVAGTLSRDEADRDRLISLMTDGKAVKSNIKPKVDASNNQVVLEVKDIGTRDKKVKNVGFKVHKGEILGIFGLAGAGRTESLEAIYGLRQRVKGEIKINGKRADNNTPIDSLKNGMVMIPEDRRGQGIIMSMSIRENITMPILSQYTNAGIINSKREEKDVESWVEQLSLKSRGIEQKVSELSGGNQQKAVFVKAMMCSPNVYLCDEPTQGVDVMTRDEIHRLLRSQADEGCGIVYVSSDLLEVLEVSDRIVIMRSGETVAELSTEGVSPEQVLQICYRQSMDYLI